MVNHQTEAIKAIETQQAAVKYHSHQWMVGEQLKDICRREPRSAELLAQDLKADTMSIIEAEKKIHAFARKNSGCASAIETDRILREFYGLPELNAAEPPASPKKHSSIIDMMDFL